MREREEIGYDQEAKYFAQKEAEARDKLRKRLESAAQELHAKREIGQALGTSDEELAERIHGLGFNAETARILDLLPLIHVAWADGSVQKRERQAILQILESRGIPPGSEAWIFVESLLETRPSQTFLDETLQVVRDLVARQGRSTRDIVELSLEVAEASGGFLGLAGKVSAEERELLARIADGLGESAREAFRTKLAE